MVFFALVPSAFRPWPSCAGDQQLRWPALTFAYMTLLAYVGALLTYQVGTFFTS